MATAKSEVSDRDYPSFSSSFSSISDDVFEASMGWREDVYVTMRSANGKIYSSGTLSREDAGKLADQINEVLMRLEEKVNEEQ